jgi:hypothetical protein
VPPPLAVPSTPFAIPSGWLWNSPRTAVCERVDLEAREGSDGQREGKRVRRPGRKILG